MLVHLRVQRPLGQRLLQFVDQPIGIEGRLRIGTTNNWSSSASWIRGDLRRAIVILLGIHYGRP